MPKAAATLLWSPEQGGGCFWHTIFTSLCVSIYYPMWVSIADAQRQCKCRAAQGSSRTTTRTPDPTRARRAGREPAAASRLGVRSPGTTKRIQRSYIMKHVSLGGLDVSRIGLGTMTMAGVYTTGAGLDDAESIRAIHRA